MKRLHDFHQVNIDLGHYSLRQGNGDEEFMEPRLIKLLHVLHQNSNHVVTKDEIMKSAWGDALVTDESISRAVFDLRKDLTKRFSNPPTIESIRKVGYRLVTKDNPTQNNYILKTTIKFLGYLLAMLVFLVILIRAINY